MATFHVFGIPVTIFEVVPSPEELAEEYKRIYNNKDDASNERVLDIECTMHKEYNLVQGKGRQWEDYDDGTDDEEEEKPSGNWFTRAFS